MNEEPVKTSTWNSSKAVPLLVLAGILAYCNTFTNPFVFDDDLQIVRKVELDYPKLYVEDFPHTRSLVYLSFALNKALNHMNVAGYHSVNLFIHIGCGLILYDLIRRTLLLPRWRGRFTAPAASGYAFAIAFLWLLHPLNTQAVTYIVQRFESLMGLFYFLTVYCLLRSATGNAWLWGLGCLASYICGFACKEVIVLAPILLFLFDRAFLVSPDDGPKKECKYANVFRLIVAGAHVFLGLILLVGLIHINTEPINDFERFLVNLVAKLSGLKITADPTQPIIRFGSDRLGIILLTFGLLYGIILQLSRLKSSTWAMVQERWLLVVSPVSRFLNHYFPSTWGVIRNRWLLYSWFAVLMAWQLGTVLGIAFGGNPQSGVGMGTTADSVTNTQYAYTESEVILHYLRLSVAPFGLCFDYKPWPIANSFHEVFPAAVIIATLLLTTFALLFRNYAIGFLGAWFFIILAPTSSIMPIIDVAFDFRMYVPLAAVMAFCVFAGAFLINRAMAISGRSSLARRNWTISALVLIAVTFGTLTFLRNRIYQSASKLWADTIKRYPNHARGYGNLGQAFMSEEKYQEAIEPLEKAGLLAQKYGGDPELILNVFNNLSESYRMLGDLQKAENGMRTCVIRAPERVRYRSLLIRIYLLEKEIPAGLFHADRALALPVSTPAEIADRKDCRLYRAALYLEAGLDDLARKNLDEVAREDPYWPKKELELAKEYLYYAPEKRPKNFLRTAEVLAWIVEVYEPKPAAPNDWDAIAAGIQLTGTQLEAIAVRWEALMLQEKFEEARTVAREGMRRAQRAADSAKQEAEKLQLAAEAAARKGDGKAEQTAINRKGWVNESEQKDQNWERIFKEREERVAQKK